MPTSVTRFSAKFRHFGEDSFGIVQNIETNLEIFYAVGQILNK